jgi:hypothetical protein
MPLGMSADSDIGEAVIELVQGGEQVMSVTELRGGAGPVAADDERAGDTGFPAACDDVGQVGAVSDLLS